MQIDNNGKWSRSVNSCGSRHMRQPQGSRFKPAFSMVELLVAIGIIVILAGILIPTISGVRRAGMRTKSAAIVSNLSSAVQRYQQEFGAYPGPWSNRNVFGVPDRDNTNPTMAENLFLALSGGLEVTSAPNVTPVVIQYNANLVGTGPRSLNPASAKINRQYPPSIEGVPFTPIGQNFRDDSGQANDTVIPEYLDGYGDPLPILYLRANLGARSNRPLGSQSSVNNDVCTEFNPTLASSILGQYDLSQLSPYTNTMIGVGKDSSKSKKYSNPALFPAHGLRTVDANLTLSIKEGSANYLYPYDAYALLGDPQFFDTATQRFKEPRQRDGFVLIAAGPDRIYGTEDDIYSFGALE